MSNHKAKVVSLISKKKERDARTDFLDLIDADITNNPGSPQPLPSSLMSDLDELCEAAQANQESEAIEC
jgi:hypothetical protein